MILIAYGLKVFCFISSTKIFVCLLYIASKRLYICGNKNSGFLFLIYAPKSIKYFSAFHYSQSNNMKNRDIVLCHFTIVTKDIESNEEKKMRKKGHLMVVITVCISLYRSLEQTKIKVNRKSVSYICNLYYENLLRCQ